MDIEGLIRRLEAAWDIGGFLHAVRSGKFDESAAGDFLELLRSISIADGELVPKRLISLTWMLAVFLEWQTKSIGEVSGDTSRYENFVNEVQTTLEEVLGVP